MPIRLAVDCMGGDHGPSVTLPACRAFLAAHPAGRADARRPRRRAGRGRRLGALHASSPRPRWSRWTTRSRWRCAARRIRRCASRSARSSRADRPSLAQACVSAGNTGALMAVARYVLKTLDGIDRPAIATVMPNERDGYTTVLDLGANVDCTAEHLLQFAVMGSALVAAVEGKDEPTRRPAQHRRRGDQGQRDDQAGRRAAARRGRRRPSQLPRQRRRQRHLQGHDRHRRLRRLRRQRRAEDRRRPGDDADAASSSRSSRATPLHQAGGAGRAAGAQRASSTGSTTAATTARRCSACAAWCSRATARPTPSPSSRR